MKRPERWAGQPCKLLWLRITMPACFMLVSTIGLLNWPASVAAQSTTANVSVVLVLDNSGSMGAPGVNNPSDPERLRFAAAKMFVKLLDVGDRVGLVLFADGVVDSADLVTVGSEGDKDAFLPKLNEREAGGFTNMKSALERAAEILRGDTSGNEKFVVFLTDGRPEIDGTNPETPEKFGPWWDETLEVARGVRAPILSIGLTAEGDTQYLRQLSALTGGRSFPAVRSDQLAAAYLQVFGHLKDRLVAEPADGSTAQAARFRVGGGIRRAYFVVVSHQPPQASLSVSGAQAPVASWTEKRFSVFTYAPESGAQVPPGDWAVQLSAPADSVRAILISRFRLRVASPGAGVGPVGRPLRLSAYLSELRDDGSSVRLPSDRIEVQIEAPGGASARPALTDDGMNGDARAGDLLYGFDYGATDAAGLYRMRFTAYSGGQAIANDAPIDVQLEPFPTIVIDAPESREYRLTGDPLPIRARLVLGQQGLVPSGGALVADLLKDGRTVNQVGLRVDGQAFVGDLRPTEGGPYMVRVRAEDVVYKERPVDAMAEVPFQVNLLARVTLDGVPVQFTAFAGGPLREVEGSSTVRVDAAEPMTLRVAPEGGPITQLRLEPESPKPGDAAVVKLVAGTDATLAPGTYDGRITWAATRESQFVPSPGLPYRLDVKQPVITLARPDLEIVLPDGCAGTAGAGAVDASVQASGPLSLTATPTGPDGITWTMTTATVPPGGPTPLGLSVRLVRQFSVGRYAGEVQLAGAHSATIQPSEKVRVAVVVPSWVERNASLIRLLAIPLALLLALLPAMMRPSPWGRFVVAGETNRPRSGFFSRFTGLGSVRLGKDRQAPVVPLRTVASERVPRATGRRSARSTPAWKVAQLSPGAPPRALDDGMTVSAGGRVAQYQGHPRPRWGMFGGMARVMALAVVFWAGLAYGLPALLGEQLTHMAGGC